MCSLLIRKDLRDLFEQLAISYRSMAVNTTKLNGVKPKTDQPKKPHKLGKFLLHLLIMNSKLKINSVEYVFDACKRTLNLVIHLMFYLYQFVVKIVELFYKMKNVF